MTHPVTRTVLLACAVGLGALMVHGPAPAVAEETAVRNEGGDERTPRAGRTLVFPRSQVKYTLHRNYLHGWPDRPLFQDSSTYHPEKTRYTLASYRKVLDSLRPYGVDGMAALVAHGGMLDRYLDTLELHERIDPHGLGFLPEFGNADHLDVYDTVLEHALASEHTPRIDGKVVITSYRADSSSPDEWRETLETLREKHGDTFAFLPCVAGQTWRTFRPYFRDGKGEEDIPDELIEEHKEILRGYLDATDGLYFAGVATVTMHDPLRFNRFGKESYEFMVGLFREVLAEPAYQDKYFGLSASIGHHNETTGHVTTNENGTRTLRTNFEVSLAADPDIIILPEWDEMNENRGIQPTVYSSFSSQRILRYYMHRIRGEAPTPNPGDDRSIPNLTVSYRMHLKAGEALEIELLNVPDADSHEQYTAKVTLSNLDGEVVEQLPERQFTVGELEEHRHKLASETLIDEPVLRPRVEITNADGERITFEDGLHHIHINPTWAWTYKWVKQPLRDVAQPSTATFEASVDSGADHVPGFSAGAVNVRGTFEGDERIASVEVMADGTERYAYDIYDEYALPGSDTVLFRVSLDSMFSGGGYRGAYDRIEGTMTLENAEFRVKPEDAVQRVSDPAIHLSFDGRLKYHRGEFYLLVARDDLDDAVLDIDLNLFSERIALRDVVDQGSHVQVFDGALMFGIETHTRAPEHPFHLEREHVDFETTVYPDRADSILHLRVVTTCGRIYRSAPVMPLHRDSGETIELPIYSRMEQDVVPVEVDPERVPHLDFELDPANRALLPNPAGRYFTGVLGAGPNQMTSGVGGGTSGNYGNVPRHLDLRGHYPDDVTATAPQWEQLDGRDVLRFDGTGQIIALPREAHPRGAFTVRFDVKPERDGGYYLYAHYGHYTGNFRLGVDSDGRLAASFLTEPLAPGIHRRVDEQEIQTDLEVPSGEWSEIEAVYDLDELTFRVNGRSETFSPEVKLPWFYYPTAAFGGWGEDEEFFAGHLRAMTIVHGSHAD